MTHLLPLFVTGLLAICAASVLSRKLGLATPLVLVAVGLGIGLLPGASTFELEPEVILQGVLPPLLYSAAVSMPALNFRRELRQISILSVLLVLATALALAAVICWLLPGTGFAMALALGAVISPTDAVATSIIKKYPVSKRVTAMLEGEGLINDASALVILRMAVAGVAGGMSFWGGAAEFGKSVLLAVVIGGVVGFANLWVRARVQDAAAGTVISFTVPFLAAIPTEHLGGSGLVAAVVAGLVTGAGQAARISPQHRLSDSQTWHTIEFMLEGFIFLTMGIELMHAFRGESGSGTDWTWLLVVALAAFACTLLVRALFVAPLFYGLQRAHRRYDRARDRLEYFEQLLRDHTPELHATAGNRTERRWQRFARRVRSARGHLDYYVREPLNWRDGTAVVWAGMRGAVTVAAAQTLPASAPHRTELVLIAYLVALISLLVQGGSMGWILRLLADPAAAARQQQVATQQRQAIKEKLAEARASVPEPLEDTEEERLRYLREVVARERRVLLDAQRCGAFDSEILAEYQADLDGVQIQFENRQKRQQ